MTSVVVGGLFNAVAFAGAGYLFSKLNHGGYEDEIKRHNHALEKLAEAKEKWYEHQVERTKKKEERRQELSDANSDINKTNNAIKDYGIIIHGKTYTREPHISDYYKPSNEMEEYQHIVIGFIGLGGGWGGYKIISKFFNL